MVSHFETGPYQPILVDLHLVVFLVPQRDAVVLCVIRDAANYFLMSVNSTGGYPFG